MPVSQSRRGFLAACAATIFAPWPSLEPVVAEVCLASPPLLSPLLLWCSWDEETKDWVVLSSEELEAWAEKDVQGPIRLIRMVP